jgi:hypothetical protein
MLEAHKKTRNQRSSAAGQYKWALSEGSAVAVWGMLEKRGFGVTKRPIRNTKI